MGPPPSNPGRVGVEAVPGPLLDAIVVEVFSSEPLWRLSEADQVSRFAQTARASLPKSLAA